MPNSDTETNPNSASSDPNTDTYSTSSDTNTGPNGYTDCDSDRHADTNAAASRDADTSPSRDADTNTDPDTSPSPRDADADTSPSPRYANANADAAEGPTEVVARSPIRPPFWLTNSTTGGRRWRQPRTPKVFASESFRGSQKRPTKARETKSNCRASESDAGWRWRFTAMGEQPRSRSARLSNDTAALQNLAMTQTTLTWTCGGSSQFSRATFEYSTDNGNYTPLGNSTAAGSNWSLTGLSLPTRQNFYIRARGYLS